MPCAAFVNWHKQLLFTPFAQHAPDGRDCHISCYNSSRRRVCAWCRETMQTASSGIWVQIALDCAASKQNIKSNSLASTEVRVSVDTHPAQRNIYKVSVTNSRFSLRQPYWKKSNSSSLKKAKPERLPFLPRSRAWLYLEFYSTFLFIQWARHTLSIVLPDAHQQLWFNSSWWMSVTNWNRK